MKFEKMNYQIVLYVAAFITCCIWQNVQSNWFQSTVEQDFCGTDNCYEVVGVSQDATDNEIKKVFRKKAIILHPDKSTDPDAPKKMEKLNKAYAVLMSAKKRGEYNLYLNDPNAFRNKLFGIEIVYPTKTNFLFAILLIVFVISLIQYIIASFKISNAKLNVLQNRSFLKLVAEEFKKKFSPEIISKMSDAEREREIALVRKQLLDQCLMDGSLGIKPLSLRDYFFVKVVKFPYTFIKYIVTFILWHFNYTLLKKDFSYSAREYLTYTRLHIIEEEWKKLPKSEQEDNMKLQLWVPEKYESYLQEVEEQDRQARMKSGKYRKYLRMRKKGPSAFNYDE